jgi:hypothetical protein
MTVTFSLMIVVGRFAFAAAKIAGSCKSKDESASAWALF